MIKVLTVAVLLAVAQIIPSCDKGGSSGDSSSGRSAVVIGWVEEKRVSQGETLPHIIIINSREYGVFSDFWFKVSVGDLVKYDGTTWTIVKKARP